MTNEFVVTCVGQIQPRKGIYDFIETAEKCPDITFVWVGGTPFKGLTAEYKKLQTVVKNAPKISFLPALSILKKCQPITLCLMFSLCPPFKKILHLQL